MRSRIKKLIAGAAGSGAALWWAPLALAQVGTTTTTTPGVPSTGAGDVTTWVILGLAALAVIVGIMYFARSESGTTRS